MKVRGLRWWVIVLIFLAAVLNYVDRQTLSALAPTIQHDLAMDDRAYANIVNLFLVAYTVSYLVSGKIVDVFGTRLGMVMFVAWWSVANMLTAAAVGIRSMSAYRFLLGLGEAGVWPAASKAVSEWFPARERALAIGLYTMGSTIGATVAPYIVIPLATYAYQQNMPWLHELLGPGTGWRVAFLITGFAGLVWLVPWFFLYRQPRQSRFIREEELRLIEGSEAKRRQGNGCRKRIALDLEAGPDVSGHLAAVAGPADHGPGLVFLPILVSKISALGARFEPGTTQNHVDRVCRSGRGQHPGRMAFRTVGPTRERSCHESNVDHAGLCLRHAGVVFDFARPGD